MKLIEFNNLGLRRERFVARQYDVEMMASQLETAGYQFETEVLACGSLHLECLKPEEIGDPQSFPIILGIQLGLNDNNFLLVLDKLVESSYKNYKENWRGK